MLRPEGGRQCGFPSSPAVIGRCQVDASPSGSEMGTPDMASATSADQLAVLVVDESPIEAQAIADVLLLADMVVLLEDDLRENPSVDLDAILTADPSTNRMSDLRTHYGEIPVLMIVPSRNPNAVVESLRCGATGVLHRSVDGRALVAGVRLVVQGHTVLPDSTLDLLSNTPELPELSDEDRFLLRELVACSTVTELCDRAGFSRSAVYRRLGDLYGRLGVETRQEALLLAGRLDLGNES